MVRQFRKARKPFFWAAAVAALINGGATAYFDLGTPLVAFLVSAALFSIGLMTRDPKIHGPLVIVQSVLLVGAILGPLVRL